MKIRTDFVTNSSSYSSAYIVIDNPVLLEILQRYKDLGVFTDDSELSFAIGCIKPDGDFDEEHFGRETKTPAFFFYKWEGSPFVGCPKSLDEVLTYIIDAMNSGDVWRYYDLDIYWQMEEELRQREDEIKDGYLNVMWNTSEISNDKDVGDEESWKFSYNQENGEKYEVEYYDGRSIG